MNEPRRSLAFGVLLLAVAWYAMACGAPADRTIRAGDQGPRPARIRFEEDRVTCYLTGGGGGISCVRDADRG